MVHTCHLSYSVKCKILRASMSRSLDLTGNKWGLRKKRHKDRHIESMGLGGSSTPDGRCQQPLLPTSTFIYTAGVGKRGEMQVNRLGLLV
jgi:hypothetical protein